MEEELLSDLIFADNLFVPGLVSVADEFEDEDDEN